MLKIRLQRTGRKNAPAYRIVVAEHARPVQGKYIEILGYYLPTRTPVEFEVDTKKVEEWMKKGAQPTDTMARLLKVNGMKDMESFISTYTKKKKKNAPEEEEAPAAPPAAESTDAPAEAAEQAPVEEAKAEPEATVDTKEEKAEETPEESKDEAKAEPETAEEKAEEPAAEETSEPEEEADAKEEKKD